LPNERGDVAIIQAIVDIASALGMTVTAEGVESEAQCFCSASSAAINFKAICLASPFLPKQR
jgi:EAL domain-containing protein (putative c-di-GMP-specific phosphodiesterase class I)